MTPAAILTQIQTVLKAAAVTSGTLSYVNPAHIYLGIRTNIPEYPVIVIEPGPNKKLRDEYPDELWTMRVTIAAGIKIFNADLQIVGSATVKGMADFENDIKKVLSQDHTLSGTAINVTISDAMSDNGVDWPIRAFLINIDVQYRQNRLTRA